VVLPESLVSIEDYAFAGCTGLKKIKFSQGLKKIGSFSFFGEFSFSPIELQYFYRTLKHRPNYFHQYLK